MLKPIVKGLTASAVIMICLGLLLISLARNAWDRSYQKDLRRDLATLFHPYGISPDLVEAHMRGLNHNGAGHFDASDAQIHQMAAKLHLKSMTNKRDMLGNCADDTCAAFPNDTSITGYAASYHSPELHLKSGRAFSTFYIFRKRGEARTSLQFSYSIN